MKSMRRGLALLLAAMLILPTLPVSAGAPATPETKVNVEDPTGDSDEETKQEETKKEETTAPSSESSTEKKKEEATPAEGDATEKKGTETETTKPSEPAKAPSRADDESDQSKPEGEGTNNSANEGEESSTEEENGTPKPVDPDEVRFNTGNHEWSIVSPKAFEQGIGDGQFKEDGSYTINIPEENPFFPYEVQFTYQGEVTTQWFMTPEASVQVGEHTFGVSAYFDNTVVTQMNLDVAGDTVVVYPEEKEFTNDGDGTTPASLLPLTEKNLRADLSGHTPAELTMVSLSSIFMGSDSLKATDKVAWASNYDDNYTVSTAGSKIDLSMSTGSGSSTWQMIVGDGTQLNDQNVRNIVNLTITASEKWLTPVVYVQDGAGRRTNIPVSRYYYYDYDRDGRNLEITVPYDKLGDIEQAYVGLSINPSVFSNTKYDHFKVYEGQYADPSKAAAGTDITSKVFSTGMTQANGGYLLKRYERKWVTMVTFDRNNNPTGCLPFSLNLYTGRNSVGTGSLYYRTGTQSLRVSGVSDVTEQDGYRSCIETLYAGYPANGTYYLTMNYYMDGSSSSDSAKAVTAAYVGDYASIAKANAAGAKNIKDALFSRNSSTGGYPADYSNGVNFTVFVGADGTANQGIYHLNVKAEAGTITPSGSTDVRFSGLKDAAGTVVDCYVVNSHEDSYAEYSYLTILVGPNVDVTKLAPEFTTDDGINLYAAGSTSPEVTGKSIHDFSKGAVHYTASSENKENQKNYWLQVVRATNGAGWIYINSLADSDSGTTNEGGVTRSTREVMLNGYYDYEHDILLANMGTDPIANLSVELSSSVLELDSYWTMDGKQALAGFSTTEKDYMNASHGELPNLAKIRIKAKSSAAKGTDISGTLTIKSGNTTLVVLNLTGLIGDPCITTEEIPQAVKYVPYGTMIQNNNKYSFNKVSYYFRDGKLPEGMEVKKNGELYGVPKEAGTFTFTVQMQNSYYGFEPDEKTYTFTVLENTDANVDAATDTGYNLTQRIQDIYLGEINDSMELMKVCESLGQQTMVSQGEYVEFVDIFLDGKKLVPGEYTSNSGSTRITIGAETLVVGGEGTHTLGIEFRTGDDRILKRAAQNYRVYFEDAPDNENNSSSGRSHGGHSGDDVNYATVVMRLVDASGKAMPGLTLELHSTPKITKTDQNGIAIFYGVESGKHTLFVKDSNGNVLASKNFEVMFGDTTLLNGDQIIIKRGATSTLNMQMNGNALTFLSLQAGDLYQVVPAKTGDDTEFKLWYLLLFVFGGAGLSAYWYYKRKGSFMIR